MGKTLRAERLLRSKVFANKKLRWRQRARRHMKKCDDYATRVLDGKSVGFSVIMEAAHKIIQLGEEGIELVTELNALRLPRMVVTRNHIAAICNALESQSTVLEYLLSELTLPSAQFPTYRSELRTPMTLDLSPLESTDFIIKQMAEHAKEKDEKDVAKSESEVKE